MNIDVNALKNIPAHVANLDDAGYAAAYAEAERIGGGRPTTLLVPPQMSDAAISVTSRAVALRPAGSHPMQGITDVRWDVSLSDAPHRWYIVGENATVARELPLSQESTQ